MSSDMEELAREGMRQFTATLHASPDLAARTYERHKRRRRAGFTGLGVACAAAGTALALGLTGVLGPSRPPAAIRTASFTLIRNANGTATLTINPLELFDPAALQSDLAQYGIPATVTSGGFCSSDPHPAGFSQVVSVSWPSNASPQSGVQPTITIDPWQCRRAPSSASAISSSARARQRASSRPTSCSSTPAPIPAPAPRLTRAVHQPATANLTAPGGCTAVPAQPGRNQLRAATARSCPGTPDGPTRSAMTATSLRRGFAGGGRRLRRRSGPSAPAPRMPI